MLLLRVGNLAPADIVLDANPVAAQDLARGRDSDTFAY